MGRVSNNSASRVVAWSVQRLISIRKKNKEISVVNEGENISTKKKLLLITPFIIYPFIPLKLFENIIFFVFLPLNLAVNFITGMVRRVLAPTRYIIRPSIEFAKANPKTFLTLLGITLAITAMLAVSIFTAGLPLFGAIGGILLASSIGIKIAAISGFFVSAWAVLLKSATMVFECSDGIQKLRGNKSTHYQQFERVDTLNGQKGYELYSMYLQEVPDKTKLDDQYKNTVPMLIRYQNELWIYGAAPKAKTKLTKIGKPHNESISFVTRESSKVEALIKNEVKDIPDKVYYDISKVRGHFVERTGTTAEISCALHAINPELTEVKSVENQDACYTFALFTGTEALFFPKKPVSAENTAIVVSDLQLVQSSV